jgi:hypothetical protein
VSFSRDAHVIPAAFGNRSLFSLEECNECNEHIGGPLENDLATFLSLPRAVSRLPKRKGHPKIQHPGEAAYVQSNRDANTVYVFQPTADEGIRVDDDGEGVLRLKIKMPSYRPANVAKALGRMLLFGLERDFPGFDRLRSWVCGEVTWYPIPLIALHFPGTGYSVVGIMAHRCAHSPGRTILRITFRYSSFLIVMPVPMDEWSLPSGIRLLNYPTPYMKALLENTSAFLVRDDAVEAAGTATAEISYRDRRVVDGSEIKPGQNGGDWGTRESTPQ